ncbi:MAG: hypothetical protein VB118_10010 [Oscillospiraceae bacterium]|nr:hypothetical protein [Oscillospiraceae bacterium]
MKTELSYYDIYPKVTVDGEPAEITIKPLGSHVKFRGSEYRVAVWPLYKRDLAYSSLPTVSSCYNVKPGDDGALRFTHTFHEEQEHLVMIYSGESRIASLPVFSVGKDLKGRYPFIGDLHVHSCYSDGREDPAIVAANLRKCGYDFSVISDHYRYYPSLKAIDAYKNIKHDFLIVPGEEIHLPSNPFHIVNFGSKYSVNGIISDGTQAKEVGTGAEFRSMENENENEDKEIKCPDVMTSAEFTEKMLESSKTLNLPEGFPRYQIAVCKWICDHIRRGGGLAIFPHPNWIDFTFHVPETVTDYLLASGIFDAFEVLGGERYFEQNGFQTSHYYDALSKGIRVPVVGSSDSHGTINNINFDIAKTIVFSPENKAEALVDSIKNYYSVAVDNLSKEYRLVGEYRFVKYGSFLIENFFPLHDELCFEEGRLMKDYITGENAKEAAASLGALYGRTGRQKNKYFAF